MQTQVRKYVHLPVEGSNAQHSTDAASVMIGI